MVHWSANRLAVEHAEMFKDLDDICGLVNGVYFAFLVDVELDADELFDFA